MNDRERSTMEKILCAYYLLEETWDGKKYRSTLDECFFWIMDAQDKNTSTYIMYDMLYGRASDRFKDFLLKELGYPDDETARQDLFTKYMPRAATRLVMVKEGKR